MLDDLAIRLRQNIGFVTPIVLFCVFYLLYNLAHPKGFSSAVLVQNGDEIFALAMLAMAQTVPVLMSGLDLSVGAIMTMVGCVVRHFKNYGIALAPQDGGARINISDSISSENRAGGILFSPPVGAVSSYAALNRITVQGNGANGLTILGSGTTGLVSTLVSNSNFSNNTGDGINVQSANNFNTNLNVESSQFYANSYGLEVYTGVTRLSNVFAQENINGDLNNGVDQDTMFGVFSYGDNEIGSKSGAAMATLSQQ